MANHGMTFLPPNGRKLIQANLPSVKADFPSTQLTSGLPVPGVFVSPNTRPITTPRAARRDTSGKEPARVLNRAPWQPRNARTVILEGCGHVELAWPLVRIIGSITDSVYCETCKEWRNLWRTATAAEAAGITLDVLPYPDDPPF
jgi:hypothetical protein